MSTVITGEPLPLVDDFGSAVPAGKVIGSTTRTGHRRQGVDAERVLSIDHRAARIQPLVQPGWARSALAYGPFVIRDGLIASVVLLNGRNGSENLDPWPSPTNWIKQWIRGTQSDGPAGRLLSTLRFPHRDRLSRRLQAARADARCPPADRQDVNLAVAWTPSVAPDEPDRGPALIVRAAGPENADLCLAEFGELRAAAALLELPMRLVFLFTGGQLAVLAAIGNDTERWPRPTFLGTMAVPAGGLGWLSIQQRTLGQVGWGMDTRIREVHIDHLAEYPTVDELAAGAEIDSPCSIPRNERRTDDPVVLVDRFEGSGRDLAGTTGSGHAWRHVVGRRQICLDNGAAAVGPALPTPNGRVARLFRPTGQRTAYVVDWDGRAGSISTEITPPGTRRGDGDAGRAGLILFQDPENYLIVNDWLDDEYGGASVSSFRRIDGHEEVYDAVWTNVGRRILWGRRHELTLAFDPSGFTAYVDGEAVLDREYRDVYPNRGPVNVKAVGICANWEFGDDTGSRFQSFTARGRSTP
jgi:hypothetical protein